MKKYIHMSADVEKIIFANFAGKITGEIKRNEAGETVLVGELLRDGQGIVDVIRKTSRNCTECRHYKGGAHLIPCPDANCPCHGCDQSNSKFERRTHEPFASAFGDKPIGLRTFREWMGALPDIGTFLWQDYFDQFGKQYKRLVQERKMALLKEAIRKGEEKIKKAADTLAAISLK